MSLWLGALTQGVAYALLAWSVYLSLRVLRFPDITVDGSLALGGATAAMWLARGGSPLLALPLAAGAGMLAGLTTGLLQARLGVQDLLAGILTMTALFSINLRLMGRSNQAVDSDAADLLERFGLKGDMADLALFSGVALILFLALRWFLRTDYGLALRATGDGPAMLTANGGDPRWTRPVGLALSNALAALAGALLAQYQGFADVTMGIGSLVAGIASVTIGERLFRRQSVGIALLGAVLGAILFRAIIAAVLLAGANPNDLKLLTALLTLVVLVVPRRRVA